MLFGRLSKRARFLKQACVLAFVTGLLARGYCAEPMDKLLDILMQRGVLTEEEGKALRAEATGTNALPPSMESKWKLSNAIKSVELFGDIRLRYEHRQATTPVDDRLELDRGRGALRLGLRGDAFDDFYFGLRLDTSSNPRSPWVTFGSSQPGPFGKSSFGINVGQAYIGWRPADWLDLTVGKMPNPLYTTPMVWDPDLTPEGAAERFRHSVGKVDFFATFAQFLYQDNNPSYISGSLLNQLQTANQPGFPGSGSQVRPLNENRSDNTFLVAWQAGVDVHVTKDVDVKVAPALYDYFGLEANIATVPGASPNGIGDPFIGEGSYGGPGSGVGTVNGLTASSTGIIYNQVGVNNLLVLEVPFEVNFKISHLNARVFGDYAYNFNGVDRANAAVNALAAAVAGTPGSHPPLLQYGPQTHDVHAYQAGFAIANKDSLGLVYGTTSRKHAWEFRTYWQHIEQYALDPNLLDSDFFEGRANLQGIYAALAYGLSDNVIGTFRYGYAWRINDKLGTGGSNLDIPQINPIDKYNLLQLDLTLRF
jgi:hypothetical protein